MKESANVLIVVRTIEEWERAERRGRRKKKRSSNKSVAAVCYVMTYNKNKSQTQPKAYFWVNESHACGLSWDALNLSCTTGKRGRKKILSRPPPHDVTYNTFIKNKKINRQQRERLDDTFNEKSARSMAICVGNSILME